MTPNFKRDLLVVGGFLAFLASIPLWGSHVFGGSKISGPTCLDRMRRVEIVGQECRPDGEYGRYNSSR